MDIQKRRIHIFTSGIYAVDGVRSEMYEAARGAAAGVRRARFDARWGMRRGARDAAHGVRCARRLSRLVQELGNRKNARRAMRDARRQMLDARRATRYCDVSTCSDAGISY